METIPETHIPVFDEFRRLFWRWRLYFVNKDNQLQGEAEWTPTAALADGAVSSTTVNVTGAVVNSPALATHENIGANNVLVSAHVQAAGVVRVTLMNKTGAPLTIAVGTVLVTVFRRQ